MIIEQLTVGSFPIPHKALLENERFHAGNPAGGMILRPRNKSQSLRRNLGFFDSQIDLLVQFASS